MIKSIALNDYLDSPKDLAFLTDEEIGTLQRKDVEAFQLEAARRKLARQAKRIPALGKKLGDNDPFACESVDDFIPFLYVDSDYKSYDKSCLENKQFDKMTEWLDAFTSYDLSNVDMEGCENLTEWCKRLHEQTNIFICHSSGTSGTLGFVPRSQADRDLIVDAMAAANPDLFDINKCNSDVYFFTISPRRIYRVPQVLYDGLEDRYLKNPVISPFEEFISPEMTIAMSKLRKAADNGTLEECFKDPVVAACAADVGRLPKRHRSASVTALRTSRTITSVKVSISWVLSITPGKSLVPFGKLVLREHFRPTLRSRFLAESKRERNYRRIGVSISRRRWYGQNHYCLGHVGTRDRGRHGMRRGDVPLQCTHHSLCARPGYRKPLPRKGTQTAQLAALELVSEDCWGGIITGDPGTVHWEKVCDCGLNHGPLLELTIERL